MIQTIADALAAQGYDTLTPVQEAVSDPALVESDLLVSAQTGSGKTVGFGLAIAPTLLGDNPQFAPAGPPLALVIAPTRELAMQVQRELTWLYKQAGASVMSCVGGMDARTERRALDRGAHVVVATPGRLCDHIKRGNIDLSNVRAVVLDEADEMLDLGFREELEYILSEAPSERRTLMFSATVPTAIARLAQSYQRDAQRVNVKSDTRQHADIEYRALNVHARDAENAILNVLRFYEARNSIVFCNTRAAVTRLTTRLSNRNFSVVALSGELTQSERSNALQALRDGRARVCVATDVAARGIDLPDLELVVHADLPSNSDTLLHRSGRTGRAGRKGVSALIVPPKMRSKANRLLGGAKLQVEWASAPSAAEVNAADEQRLLADSAWTDPAPEDAADFVAQLTERFAPEQLATAFVNLYRARASAPEDLTDPGAPGEERPRAAFGKSVWFSVSRGRNDGAEPRTLLPMLCRVGGLSRDDVGAIRVQARNSYVEVLETSVPQLLAALGPDLSPEEGVKLTQMDSAPDFGPDRRGPKPGGKPSFDKPRGDKPKFDKPKFDKPKFDKPRGDKPQFDKPRYDSDKPSAPHKPADAPKPASSAPAAKKGQKPPKSHKTDRSPMKAGAKPKAKSVWKDAPAGEAEAPRPGGAGKAKPVWKKPGKPAPRPAEAGEKKSTRAADPSKRFTPPNKMGKPGGKPTGKPRGGEATPRRGGKPSFKGK
ncbi:MAG: DEAD/DEAH box helicase [Sulfitobacter sp.]